MADFAFSIEGTSINLETFGTMVTTHLSGIPLFIAIGTDFYNELSRETKLTTTIAY